MREPDFVDDFSRFEDELDDLLTETELEIVRLNVVEGLNSSDITSEIGVKNSKVQSVLRDLKHRGLLESSSKDWGVYSLNLEHLIEESNDLGEKVDVPENEEEIRELLISSGVEGYLARSIFSGRKGNSLSGLYPEGTLFDEDEFTQNIKDRKNPVDSEEVYSFVQNEEGSVTYWDLLNEYSNEDELDEALKELREDGKIRMKREFGEELRIKDLKTKNTGRPQKGRSKVVDEESSEQKMTDVRKALSKASSLDRESVQEINECLGLEEYAVVEINTKPSGENWGNHYTSDEPIFGLNNSKQGKYALVDISRMDKLGGTTEIDTTAEDYEELVSKVEQRLN